MDGVKRTIINEIGHPINSFDFIVALDSLSAVNIGSLLAQQFDLPFAVIKKDENLSGEDAIWQQYEDDENSEEANFVWFCVKNVSENVCMWKTF